MTSIQSKDVEDLCLFLELEIPTLDEENIRKHNIDGATFLQLNEEYLKELAPLLGDRMKLKKIIVAGVEAISSQTVQATEKQQHIPSIQLLNRLYLQNQFVFTVLLRYVFE